MREYDGGTASAAELYFSKENDEFATRSEGKFVITLTVFWGRSTRCIRVLNFWRSWVWRWPRCWARCHAKTVVPRRQ